MANVSIYSSMPRTVFRGIKDDSAVVISMPVSSLPIHLPLFLSLAPWGEENKARFVNASGINILYGSEVLNPKTPFFTHQSQFMRANFEGGASAMFLRLVPEEATQGSMRFGIDMVADKIPEYERNLDGSYKRDVSGNKIPTGNEVDGFRLQIRKTEIPVFSGQLDFGLGAPSVGEMTSADTGDTSTFHPFFDGMARFRGGRATNLGIRLSAPTVASGEPANDAAASRMNTFIYRIQQVKRASPMSTPTVVQAWNGRNIVDFSFTPDAEDPATNVGYDINKTVVKAFEGDTPDTFSGWGHFERIHGYDNNLSAVLGSIAAAEELITGEPIDPNTINFLTGVDVNGIPYHSFIIEGPDLGGLLISENTTHYFEGGSDGDVSNVKYNELMDAVLEGLDAFHVPLYDIAAYPFNGVWDSGFPLATKLKFTAFHNLRPDVIVHACTQDALERLNSPTEDSSIGVALRSSFRAQQESAEFGTKAMRFFCQMNAGKLVSSDYDGIVPFLEDTMKRVAQYAGAGSGEMNPAYSFGRGSQNVITRFKDHNVISRPPAARNVDWSNGITYAEMFDIGDRIFVAGYQSMYENQTSVCHSYLNVLILNNLTRIGHIVWRNWTGDSKLTPEEFAAAIEQNVLDLARDKYDSRAEIRPVCYYTKLAQDLGYLWDLDIEAGLENMRTVERLAVIARRRRDMLADQ